MNAAGNAIVAVAALSLLGLMLWLAHDNSRLTEENNALRQELELAAAAADAAGREALALRREAGAHIEHRKEAAHAAIDTLENGGGDGDAGTLDGLRGVLRDAAQGRAADAAR